MVFSLVGTMEERGTALHPRKGTPRRGGGDDALEPISRI